MVSHKTGVLCVECGESVKPLFANKNGKYTKIGLYYCWTCKSIIEVEQRIITTS
jgi:hypothetical protein